VIHSRDEFMMRLYYFHLLEEPVRRQLLSEREAFVNGLISSFRSIREEEGTLYIPNSRELHDFHLELLDSELRLIRKMLEKVAEPCLLAASEPSQ